MTPDALNRDFEKYDQVRKAHTYRLAEHESDAFDDDYEIATLDFAPFLHGNDAGEGALRGGVRRRRSPRSASRS